MSATARRTRILLALVVVACWAAPTLAKEPAQGEVQLTADVEFRADGSGSGHMVMDFAEQQYTVIKAANPNPYRFLRAFASSHTDFEIGPDSKVRYDDAASAIVLDIVELGALHNAGDGQWSLQIDEAAEYINHKADDQGRTTFYFYESGEWDGGIKYRGQVRYKLPAGAKSGTWDDSSRTIQYTLARPEGTGPGRLTLDLKTKDRLMSAIYKVYGLGTEFHAQWVAKTLLENKGKSVLRDVRVRYKLEGYSSWGIWQKMPELVPGQVAVSRYYPILEEQIAGLSSNTPVNLLVEWRYTDLEGKQHEDSDGKRLVILGVHEFVFSNMTRGQSTGGFHDNHNNAPLIASWVTRDDPVVKEFASMANKIAGGKGASQNDQSAWLVIQGIYELWRRNDFTYQHPPGLTDTNISYDPRFVQNVKFPRDVIRDKSGTCIDLAICMAAMGNAVGLNPYLMLIPGHCFPVFRLPSGNFAPFEATGVSGGLRHGSASFEDLAKYGQKEFQESLQSGNFYLIPVQELWTKGVANPELPDLPADILSKWGLSVEGSAGGRSTQPATPQPQNPGPSAPATRSPYVGKWMGRVSETLDNGQQITYPVLLTVTVAQGGTFSVRGAARAELATQSGKLIVELTTLGTGRVNAEGKLFVQGTDKVRRAGGNSEKMTPDNILAVIQNGMLVGRSGNDSDGYLDFKLKRAP